MGAWSKSDQDFRFWRGLGIRLRAVVPRTTRKHCEYSKYVSIWFALQKNLSNSTSGRKIGAQRAVFTEGISGHHYVLKHPNNYPDTVGENFLGPLWSISEAISSQIVTTQGPIQCHQDPLHIHFMEWKCPRNRPKRSENIFSDGVRIVEWML